VTEARRLAAPSQAGKTAICMAAATPIKERRLVSFAFENLPSNGKLTAKFGGGRSDRVERDVAPDRRSGWFCPTGPIQPPVQPDELFACTHEHWTLARENRSEA
jgi:hypothetical protein